MSPLLCRSLVNEIARGIAELGLAFEVVAAHECVANQRCVSCGREWPCAMRLRGEEALVLQRRIEARSAAWRSPMSTRLRWFLRVAV